MKIADQTHRTQSTHQDQIHYQRPYRKLKSFKSKTQTSSNSEEITKSKNLREEKDDLVRSFILSRETPETQKGKNYYISNLFEHETPVTPKDYYKSLKAHSVRNNQGRKRDFRLPFKSLPKINTKHEKMKTIIQSCQQLVDMIKHIKGQSSATPIHSKSKNLDELKVNKIIVPTKGKIQLQPIKLSNSPQKDVKKLLHISNIQKKRDESINKRYFRPKSIFSGNK